MTFIMLVSRVFFYIYGIDNDFKSTLGTLVISVPGPVDRSCCLDQMNKDFLYRGTGKAIIFWALSHTNKFIMGWSRA